MKTILIAVLLISASAQAQTDSTTHQIQLNLAKCHKEYRTGTILMVMGILATVAGIQAQSSDMGGKKLIYAGAGLATIGGVIHIDSHKWIARCGKLTAKRRKN